MLGVLARRGEDVVLRWWRGWRCSGGAGAAVARAGVGGPVPAEGGTGGRGGHGAAVARLVAPWEREWWWRGLGVGIVYRRRGEGEGDMGRRWHLWWHPGERERRERGPGGSWWRLGEPERREWVVEVRWRCGECGGRGECAVGGGGAAPPFAGPGLIARVGPVRRCRRVLGWPCLVPLVMGVPRRPLIRHVGRC